MFRRAFGAPCLGVLAATLLATVLVAPSATAATLSAPGNLDPNGPQSTSTPTFTWDKVAKGTGYVWQIDDDSDFGTPLQSVTTPNNAYVPTKRLPDSTELFWRVRATASGSQSPWSDTNNIEIDPTAPPSPFAPIDDAPLSQPEDPALLQWNAVDGAVGYEVEVDGDGDWVSDKLYTTVGPAFQLPAPQAPQIWHWRVRADLGDDLFTRWSAEDEGGATYEILPLADVEEDESMETGEPMEDVVLKWLPVDGAAKYDVRVGKDRGFSTVIDEQTVLGTRYSPDETYDNGAYFWQVRAIDAAGNKMPWPNSQFEFQRHWPQHPELVWPPDTANPAVGDDFYYQWTPVPHATRYQLDVSEDPNFSPNLTDTCLTAGTTYAAAFGYKLGTCAPRQGAQTYWRVRALDEPGHIEGLYSEAHQFSYDSGGAQPLAPLGGSVRVPTLRWQAATDAASYDVELRDNAGTRVDSVTTFSLSWTPDGDALTAAKSPYTWTVVANDADGGSSMGGRGGSFSIDESAPSPSGPALTPATIPDGTRFPNLTWEPLSGAKYYKVSIGNADTGNWDNPDTSPWPILRNKYPFPAATDTSEHYLVPGHYKWFVTAFNEENVALVSGPVGHFNVLDLPAATGQRIALDGQALDAGTSCDLKLGATVTQDKICQGVPATPVLDWDSVPGAGQYIVYLAQDRAFTNRIYDKLLTTSSSRWAPTSAMPIEALEDNQAGEAYYWYIRPCKTINVCSADPISTNRAATNAFRKVSPAVELLSPATNSVNECSADSVVADAICSGDIAFSWRDYRDTNEDSPDFYAGDARSPQSAMVYHLQISTSPTFSTTVAGGDVSVDSATYTMVDHTMAEGTFYWRVQAVDAETNELNWSQTAKITKRSPRVDLTGPVADDEVTGASPFSWESAMHASGYEIEIYKNDDTSHSTANQVVKVKTSLASYVPSKYLPASDTAYRWRVRWFDADRDKHPGPWSDDGRFFVRKGEVLLRGPAAGSLQPPAGPVFSWDAVAFASRYRVEVRPDGDTRSAVNITTPATAYAPVRTLADDRYEWRVTALDPSGGALATSAWSGFIVDTSGPEVVKETPASTAKRTSNFVATLDEQVSGVSSTSVKLYVDGRNTPLAAKVTLSASKKVVTLNPTASLKPGKRYRIQLGSPIKDLAGNAMAKYTWTVNVKR